jgi:hypothetical protein
MRYFLLLALAVTASLPAQAQYSSRCSRDYFGSITCRDSDGNQIKIQTDYFGNTTGTYRGNDGSSARCRSSVDYFGNLNTRCY